MKTLRKFLIPVSAIVVFCLFWEWLVWVNAMRPRVPIGWAPA